MAQFNGTVPKTTPNGNNFHHQATHFRSMNTRPIADGAMDRQGVSDGGPPRGSDSNLNNHSTPSGFGIEEDGIQGSRPDLNSRSPHMSDRSVEALQFQLHNANSRLEEMTTRYMFLERLVNDQSKGHLSEIGRLSTKMTAIDSQIVSLRSALRETNRLFERMDSDFGELLLDVREYVQQRPPLNFNPYPANHNYHGYISEGAYHFESRQTSQPSSDAGWTLNGRVPDPSDDLANSFSNIRFGVQPARALNNKILPGERTNNYWDNFRSNSRQNCLSASNTDQFVSQIQSQSGPSSLPFVVNRAMSDSRNFSRRTSSDRLLLKTSSQTPTRRKLKINIEQNRADTVDPNGFLDQVNNARETNRHQGQIQMMAFDNTQNHFNGQGSKPGENKEIINNQSSSLQIKRNRHKLQDQENLPQVESSLVDTSNQFTPRNETQPDCQEGASAPAIGSVTVKEANTTDRNASLNMDSSKVGSIRERRPCEETSESSAVVSSQTHLATGHDANETQLFEDDFEDDLLLYDSDDD